MHRSMMVFALCGVAAVASAQSLPSGFNLMITVDSAPMPWMITNDMDSVTSVETNAAGNIVISGEVGDFFGTGWTYDIEVTPSPLDGGASGARLLPIASISSAFTLTNNMASTQNFTVTAVAAAMVSPGPTEILGSHSGNVGDNPAFGDGATLSTLAGSSLYDALIDGSSVQTLFDDPFSVSASPFLTNSYGPASFGFIGGFPVVTSTISIVNEFSLSGNDNAGMTSTFVVRVPAPGALAGLGVAGLLAARRRR